MRRRRLAAAVVVAAGVATAVMTAAARQAQPPDQGWRHFTASWSAVGQRHTLPTESGGTAGIARLSGAVVVTGDEGLGRGFRGEAIGFDDGRGLSVGRWVWTDDRGDRIFGELRGEPLQTGRRITGTVTGGTGRHAGIAGEFSFTWQYVVTDEDGNLQGRTVGLEGRYRPGAGSR